MVAGCGGDDRPSDAVWRAAWEERRAQVPDADEILRGGSELCDELVGRFRSDLSELLPTPDQALDAAVDDWIAHAETIVFDCSKDPDELADQFDTLDLLAAEVDAGLLIDTTD